MCYSKRKGLRFTQYKFRKFTNYCFVLSAFIPCILLPNSSFLSFQHTHKIHPLPISNHSRLSIFLLAANCNTFQLNQKSFFYIPNEKVSVSLMLLSADATDVTYFNFTLSLCTYCAILNFCNLTYFQHIFGGLNLEKKNFFMVP